MQSGFSYRTATDPAEACRVLFEEALPVAGTADPASVEEDHLPGCLEAYGTEPEGVHRGTQDEVRTALLADLELLGAHPRFGEFQLTVVEVQSAASVLCTMSETPEKGAFAVPLRVWSTGNGCIAMGVDPSWRE